MKVFIKKAAQYGAKVVSDKGKHLKFRDNLGHQISAPKTTSDWRAIKNFESELRGRGFVNQQTTRKVKDTLVKNTNVTAIPSRRTANQQTTFKDFTQKYQPNVQGPSKPNTPPAKRAPVQGPESELAYRMGRAYDKRVDAIIKSVGKPKPKTPLPAKMPKKLTDYEMYQLRNLKNLDFRQRRKLRELGLLPEENMKALNEALTRMFVKTVAKQVFKNRGVAKAVRNTIKPLTNAPKQLRFTKLYHGTNTPASAAISKGGYRTDKNVTRQMLGKGVYTSPDNYSAAMYGIRASRNYGGEPALRQLRVPQQIAKRQTTSMRHGTGDYSGKGYKMTTLSTQQANKYDVTDMLPKDKFDVKGPLISPENKRDLRRRVRGVLKQRSGREELRREIKRGEDQSLTALYRYRNNPQDPRTLEKVLRQQKKGLA